MACSICMYINQGSFKAFSVPLEHTEVFILEFFFVFQFLDDKSVTTLRYFTILDTTDGHQNYSYYITQQI